MKDLIGIVLQRIDDYFHERRIVQLGRECLRAMHGGKHVLARVIFRDLQYAIDGRSPQQWERVNKKMLDRLDPHARAVYDRVSQG